MLSSKGEQVKKVTDAMGTTEITIEDVVGSTNIKKLTNGNDWMKFIQIMMQVDYWFDKEMNESGFIKEWCVSVFHDRRDQQSQCECAQLWVKCINKKYKSVQNNSGLIPI